MRQEIAAPAAELWRLVTDPSTWPDWGPSVWAARLGDSELHSGSTGTVRTVLGINLPFEITSYEPGIRWAWKVAGVPATDHIVESLEPNRCRVSFGTPWLAAPYLLVCRRALRRLDALASGSSENGVSPTDARVAS